MNFAGSWPVRVPAPGVPLCCALRACALSAAGAAAAANDFLKNPRLFIRKTPFQKPDRIPGFPSTVQFIPAAIFFDPVIHFLTQSLRGPRARRADDLLRTFRNRFERCPAL